MTIRLIGLLRVSIVAAAMLLPLLADAQPKAPDPADDPLPEGGKVRYGISRPILRGSPHVGPIGPKFDDFIVPTADGGIRRYNLATGRPFNKGSVVNGRVVVSADGKRAAVCRAGSMNVVDVATGKRILAVEPPEGAIMVGVPGASLSADGKLLAYAVRGKANKGEVVVCEVDKNVVVARVETVAPAPVVPVLSPNGATLVTHGPPAAPPRLRPPEPGVPVEPKIEFNPDTARTAQVWEVASGQELFKARVTGMGGIVVSAAFSGDGSFVALGCGDGPIDLWDVNTGKRTHTLLGRKAMGVKVAVSPDGKTVAAIAPDYRIQRWNSADGKTLGVTDAPMPMILITEITGLAFTDNQNVVGWQTQRQFCTAWEAPSGRLLSPLTEHIASLRSLSAPIDGKDLYTSGDDGKVFRWDYVTGAPTEEVHLHPARIPGAPLVRPLVTLSADAVRASGGDNPVEVFDVSNGNNLFVLPPPSAPVAPLTYTTSPEALKGIYMCRPIDAKRTGSLVVWDMMTEKRVIELDIPPSVTAPKASMTADGSRLVVLTHTRDPVGVDSVVVTGWDVKTGKKIGDVSDQTVLDIVYVTAIGTDSAVLVSRNGRLWSVNYVTGKVGRDMDRLPSNGDAPVWGPAVFSEDGKMFALGIQGDKPETSGARVYDWPTGKPIRTYIGHVAPVMTLRFTPDNKFLMTGAQDASVMLWDLAKNPGVK
jgi:WD40 repeat protein